MLSLRLVLHRDILHIHCIYTLAILFSTQTWSSCKEVVKASKKKEPQHLKLFLLSYDSIIVEKLPLQKTISQTLTYGSDIGRTTITTWRTILNHNPET